MSNIDNFKIETVSNRTVITSQKNNLFAKVNSSAIALHNFIIVIDTTVFPAHAKHFRNKIERDFNLPVKYLFLTHSHGDHVLGASTYSDINIIGSIKIIQDMRIKEVKEWTPEAFSKWKEGEKENAELIDEIKIIIPNFGFQDKFEIWDEDLKVEFHRSGGHTECSSFAYFPTDKIIFAGDLLFNHAFPYAGDPTCDPDKWIAVLEKFLQLEFVKIIPGHGEVADRSEVKKHLEYLKILRGIIKNAVSIGLKIDDINIPDFYETDGWVIKDTITHWYKFYE